MANRTERSETEIKKEVMQYLTVMGWNPSRINNAPVRGQYKFQGRKGVWDIYCVGHGQTLWVETKKEGENLAPEQERFRDLHAGTRTWFIVARSVDDVIRELQLLTGEVFSGK